MIFLTRTGLPWGCISTMCWPVKESGAGKFKTTQLSLKPSFTSDLTKTPLFLSTRPTYSKKPLGKEAPVTRIMQRADLP